jgi:tetratricopeptide (TPR) repeat protein
VAQAGGPLRIDVLLGAAARAGISDPEAILEALGDAALIQARDPVGFDPPVLRRGALDLLKDKPWLGRVRRALLDTLAQHPAGADARFLADGYADLGLADAAREWLKQALVQARGMGAFDDAADLATRLGDTLGAIEDLLRAGRFEEAEARHGALPGPATVQGRLLGILVAYHRGRFRPDADPTLIEDAERSGDADLTARARLALATAVRGSRGIELLEASRPTDPELGTRIAVRRLELLYETDAPHEALTAAMEVVRLAAVAGGSARVALELEADQAALDGPRDPVRAIRVLRDVEQRMQAARVGSKVRLDVLSNVARCEVLAGRFAPALETAGTVAELAAQVGSWRHLATIRSTEADALRHLGRLPEARSRIDEAVDLKRRGLDSRLALTLLRRVEILCALGDHDAAQRDAEHVRGDPSASLAQRDQARLWIATLSGDVGSVSALLPTVSGPSDLLQYAKRLLEPGQHPEGE